MPTLINPTDAKIRNLVPTDKPERWGIGNNLFVVVSHTGKKTWIFRYRLHNKPKILTIGNTDNVTVDQARAKRVKAMELIAQGIDPSQKKRDEKTERATSNENTLSAVAAKWHDWWAHNGKVTSVRHIDKSWQVLEKNILKYLGKRPIQDVTYRQLVTCFDRIAERGADNVARKVYGHTWSIFKYAKKNAYIDVNPIADKDIEYIIKHKPVTSQPRISPDELPELLAKLETTPMNEQVRIYHKLMLLVFTRKNELLQARWSEFDLDAKIWTIPHARMKVRVQHQVPLSRQTIELLSDLKLYAGKSPYLFPSNTRHTDKGVLTDTVLRTTLYKMGYKPKIIDNINGRDIKWGMTVHGYRGIASTALSETSNPASPSIAQFIITKGDPKDFGKNLIVEIQLSHTLGDSTSNAYNKALHWDYREIMMQEWADWVDNQRALGVSKFG